MKSKTIILIVRRHAGEVDWLLPLLFKLHENKITQSINILRFDLERLELKYHKFFSV